MDRDELAAWLRLGLTPGVGTQTAHHLLAAFGLPRQIFSQPEAALARVVGDAAARTLQILPPALDAQIDQVCEWLASAAPEAPRRVLTLGDPDYPGALLHLADPPLLLYALGQGLPPAQPSVAIVGSRNATPQGLQNARSFARDLASRGLCVASGLALGIDGAAHEGALAGAVACAGGFGAAAGIATVAVVGTGLDRVYPRRHHALAGEIARRGLILSEYPLGTPSIAANFPRRNRLIAALSQGTLVVEAALQSGSLITARLAADIGREVFAIPGSIHSPQSRGCHALIRQGAKLVESAADVLEELGTPWTAQDAASLGGLDAAPDARPGAVPDPVAARLREALGHEASSLDELAQRTGLAPAALQAGLLALELDGEVARMPGGRFQRTGA